MIDKNGWVVMDVIMDAKCSPEEMDAVVAGFLRELAAAYPALYRSTRRGVVAHYDVIYEDGEIWRESLYPQLSICWPVGVFMNSVTMRRSKALGEKWRRSLLRVGRTDALRAAPQEGESRRVARYVRGMSSDLEALQRGEIIITAAPRRRGSAG